jgi:hypothetical protein
MFVPDPGSNFFHPGSSRIPDLGSRVKKATDPGTGSATMNVSIFNPKHRHMIRDGYPGFRVFSIPDPGIKKH